MPKKDHCAYEDNHDKVRPEFECPPCSGPLDWHIKNYWLGEARRVLGPHMVLCEAHATWYNSTPHSRYATRRRT